MMCLALQQRLFRTMIHWMASTQSIANVSLDWHSKEALLARNSYMIYSLWIRCRISETKRPFPWRTNTSCVAQEEAEHLSSWSYLLDFGPAHQIDHTLHWVLRLRRELPLAIVLLSLLPPQSWADRRVNAKWSISNTCHDMSSSIPIRTSTRLGRIKPLDVISDIKRRVICRAAAPVDNCCDRSAPIVSIYHVQSTYEKSIRS